MNLRGYSLLALTAVSIILLTLVACGGNEEAPGDTPTVTPAAQVQDTSRMSLDDYLAICAGPTAGPSDEQATLAGFASVMGEFTERLEAVEPPEEVSDWHDAVLVYQRAVKKALDDAPGPGDDESEDEYILGVLLPVALQHQPEITEAIKSMDRDLVARMLEAGCIDDEFVEESAPQIDLAVLTVGKSVEAMVDNPDLPNRYSFQAEQGGRYLIEVTRKTLTDFVVTLPVTESQFPQNFFLSEGDEQLSLRWKASTSDTYFFQVAGDGIGTYTVSVRLDLSPISPSNVKYAWDGTSIQVSWDSADGADYYNVYYDDFFETACSVGRDGRPSFCGELATNVTGTTFVHTDPDLRANYYWVVACNQHGCSSVTDRDNPAMPLGDGSGGPTTGGPCQAGVSLDEGDFCTVVNPDVQVGSDRFEVRKGSGCYNDICAGESTILDGFIAYANADGSWLVTRVPDGTSGGEGSTPVPTPTQSAVPTPTSTAIPAATATPIPVPTPVPTATATPAPEDTTPSAPANVRYALEGSAIRVTWNAVDNADYYNVYYDEFSDSSCSLGRDGSPRFCGELATNVTEMEYLHADPAHGANYYWVVACNSGGCSDVDSENSATPIVARAGRPTNVRYAVEGSTIRVSWDLVSGADFYNVYYDDFFDSSCSLGTDGSPRFCEELAANVSEATYVHTSPDSGDNYYWVVACNRGGCSEVDSENPARSIGTGTVPAPAAAPSADRAALVMLYNAMDGGNWRIDRHWLSEEPIDRWYGVTADRNGRITDLDLSGNELSGEIPGELGSLSNLVELDLSRNRLSGEIPPELGNLSNLEWLDLTGNTLTGEIPAELGGLTSLERLFLRANQLTGSIPVELGSLSNLEHLRLNHNQLNGEIPSEIGRLTKLRILALYSNELSGEIPAELGRLTRLSQLGLSNNRLSGEMPPELGNLSNLRWLYLFGNQLSGEIPGALGALTNLERLQLQGNHLSGAIPPELGHLANLKVLALHMNQLSEEIPAELGALTNLERMFLHGNQLSGAIPPELGHLTNLNVLALHSNDLSGGLPDTLTALINLIAVTVCEGNQLSCDIAEVVGEGVAVGVEAVFEVGGVVGNTAGVVGGVVGDVGGVLGDVGGGIFGGWW